VTEDNKRHNIRLEVEKSAARLADAATLLATGSFDSVLSLSYYGAFHSARALLLMDGLEAKTHAGVVHLINLHFVRSGRLTPEMGDILSQLQSRRERAEYDAAALFTETMARSGYENATRFTAQASQLLGKSGYL